MLPHDDKSCLFSAHFLTDFRRFGLKNAFFWLIFAHFGPILADFPIFVAEICTFISTRAKVARKYFICVSRPAKVAFLELRKHFQLLDRASQPGSAGLKIYLRPVRP
jgi:hypothetical protein